MYFRVDHKIVQSEFNERLQQAAHERRVRRPQANQPGLTSRGRQALGKVLVAIGQKLIRAQGQPAIGPQA